MGQYQKQINFDGWCVINSIYDKEELHAVKQLIQQAQKQGSNIRRLADIFAIRDFLNKVPGALDVLMNARLLQLIKEIFGDGYSVVKSIYFDKPANSNWFVAWHQDLTIAVKEKIDVPGYGPWTVKDQQFGVQPPITVLQDNFTIRIHLDDTDEGNGALKVIPTSHNRGICRADELNIVSENKITCAVKSGGIMIMRPLLMHSSARTTNNRSRRVIHLEFSRANLPGALQWSQQHFMVNL